MTELEMEGGYVTRGRAGALEKRIDELERQVNEKIEAIERRVDEAIAFEHELLRRRLAVEVDLVRSFTATARGRL